MNFCDINRFKQSGRSMIEMLGVLAIIGVLSVGGLTGYSKAMMKSKINSTIETMLTIASNIKTISLRSKKYDNNLLTAAIKLKAIPDKVLTSDGTIGTNAFGGSIGVSKYTDTSFYVAMNGLLKEACVDIATKDFGNTLIYAGIGDFSADKLGTLKNKNLKTEAPACSAAEPYYCLKKIMSPATAAQACNCANTMNCSVALVVF